MKFLGEETAKEGSAKKRIMLRFRFVYEHFKFFCFRLHMYGTNEFWSNEILIDLHVMRSCGSENVLNV